MSLMIAFGTTGLEKQGDRLRSQFSFLPEGWSHKAMPINFSHSLMLTLMILIFLLLKAQGDEDLIPSVQKK